MATALQEVRETALVGVPTGVYALASMTDDQFKARLEYMRTGRDRAQQVLRGMMREGIHYGKVPGKERDPDAKFGLLKPGAELLCQLYNYVPDVEVLVEYGDMANTASPAIRVRARCVIHAGSLDGPIVGVGHGAANSWEKKYRYRQGGRTCPECDVDAIIVSKYEDKTGPYEGKTPFVCLTKNGGCGTKFSPDDARLKDTRGGRVPNPDAYDLENTLVKMAEKRAKVDGTISATGTSDLFTQDVEDRAGKGAAPTAAGTPTEAGKSGEVRQWAARFTALCKRAGASKGREFWALAEKGLGRKIDGWPAFGKITDAEFEQLIKDSFALMGVSEDEATAEQLDAEHEGAEHGHGPASTVEG